MVGLANQEDVPEAYKNDSGCTYENAMVTISNGDFTRHGIRKLIMCDVDPPETPEDSLRWVELLTSRRFPEFYHFSPRFAYANAPTAAAVSTDASHETMDMSGGPSLLTLVPQQTPKTLAMGISR